MSHQRTFPLRHQVTRDTSSGHVVSSVLPRFVIKVPASRSKNPHQLKLGTLSLYRADERRAGHHPPPRKAYTVLAWSKRAARGEQLVRAKVRQLGTLGGASPGPKHTDPRAVLQFPFPGKQELSLGYASYVLLSVFLRGKRDKIELIKFIENWGLYFSFPPLIAVSLRA
jgi:hypothetical protein